MLDRALDLKFKLYWTFLSLSSTDKVYVHYGTKSNTSEKTPSYLS